MPQSRRRFSWRLLVPALAVTLAACSHPLTVDDIVARHVAARGGADKLHALQSMRATGTVDTGGGKVGRIVREIKRPGRIRLDFTYQGMTGVYAHDGEKGWQVAPLQGKFDPEPLPAETAAAAVDQLDIEGPLVDWRAKGHQVELAGQELIGGKQAYKLKVTLKGGAIRTDYLDPDTFLLLRSDVARPIRGHMVDLATTFADYKAVDGIQFPHSIVSQAKNRPQKVVITVEKIELNPEIDDARFRMPG